MIKNGKYPDFETKEFVEADVAISDGKIVAVGSVDGEAKRIIDAAGRVVSPGFIDIHMHEEQFLEDGEKYIIDTSLDVMVEELDPEKFFRISRGCIISMNAISSIIKQAGSRLKIISKPEASFEMTVSRSRVDDFLEWLER